MVVTTAAAAVHCQLANQLTTIPLSGQPSIHMVSFQNS